MPQNRAELRIEEDTVLKNEKQILVAIEYYYAVVVELLLEILKVNNVYRLQASKFTRLWQKLLLSNVFCDFSSTLVISMLIILDTPLTKTYTKS